MRAICRTTAFGVEERQIPLPETTTDHVVIKVSACGINAGDKAWIAGGFPDVPRSQYEVAGSCAAGRVIDIGPGVPYSFLGSKVAVYRSLTASSDCVGAWCEFARMHYLTCILLPEQVDEAHYAGALVSNITAYVFLQQIIRAGHKAVVCTAGTSATGLSLLGCCQAHQFPIISLTRNEAGVERLSKLRAPLILNTSNPDFDMQFKILCEELGPTAVFDGIGGRLAGRIAKALPTGSTIYCYGFLAGGETLDFPSAVLLMNDITLTSFSILRPLERDAETLRRILAGLSTIIGLPPFRRVPGQIFGFADAVEALKWQSADGGKAVLMPQLH